MFMSLVQFARAAVATCYKLHIQAKRMLFIFVAAFEHNVFCVELWTFSSAAVSRSWHLVTVRLGVAIAVC
jgi:hypothetical protein